MELIHGLTAATYTPTRDDGSLNPDVLEDYAKHLATAGVKSIFICGTTGESLSFTMKERIDLLEAWCPFARNHGLKVIFHAGSACQVEAVELSKAAVGADVDIIAAMAPPCIPPRSVDDLVEFMKPIAKACRETPFLFYDNPSRSHVDFSPNLVLGEMMASIDNFAGVKLTRCDLESLEQAIDTCGDDAQVFFACDQMLLFGLQLGVKAAIGASYNHSAGLFQRMLHAHEAGDMATATAEHDKAVVMIDVLQDHGIIPAGRAMMTLSGLDLGPPRPPLRAMTMTATAELANAMEALGLPDGPIHR